MEYATTQLPYRLFEKIGMSKKEVLRLPSSDLQALLQGRTTRLMPLKFNVEGMEVKEKAKISLYRQADDGVGIKIHPERKEVKNDYNFNAPEVERLRQGAVLTKIRTSPDGKQEKYLFALDRSINEIRSVRVKDVRVPNYLENTELSRAQKDDLRKGKAVALTPDKAIRVDLVHPAGYTLQLPDRKRNAAQRNAAQEQESVRGKKVSRVGEEVVTRQPEKSLMPGLTKEVVAQRQPTDPDRGRTPGIRR